MSPSDSKDNNCRATSFSWIVSTCINQANWSQVEGKKYKKLMAGYGSLCQDRSIWWSCRSSQAWGERHRLIQDLMPVASCSNIAGWVWNVWNMCRPWKVNLVRCSCFETTLTDSSLEIAMIMCAQNMRDVFLLFFLKVAFGCVCISGFQIQLTTCCSPTALLGNS